MRLLLDTHLLIWSIADPRRLSARAAEAIEEPRNAKLFSVASIWEIAIKRSLGKRDFDVDPVMLTDAARLDFVELPLTCEVVARVADLPRHHRDPFDRLLVAQAIDADALLLTIDTQLSSYAPYIMTVA